MKIIKQIKLENKFKINNIPKDKYEELINFLKDIEILNNFNFHKSTIGIRILNKRIVSSSADSSTYNYYFMDYKYYDYVDFYNKYMK